MKLRLAPISKDQRDLVDAMRAGSKALEIEGEGEILVAKYLHGEDRRKVQGIGARKLYFARLLELGAKKIEEAL